MKFSLKWTSIENWLSVIGATFVGGATGYVEANLQAGLSGATPWKQIAIGAGVMGVVAVVHLAQIPKSSPSSSAADDTIPPTAPPTAPATAS
jgi:hypothetical protein